MKIVTQAQSLPELLGQMPPPLRVARKDRKAMTDDEIKVAEKRERRLIDPGRINQFRDAAKEERA